MDQERRTDQGEGDRTPELWAITARVSITENGWTVGHDAPTFFLRGDAQGIVGMDHAKAIAADIVMTAVRERNPDNRPEMYSVSIDAQLV